MSKAMYCGTIVSALSLTMSACTTTSPSGNQANVSAGAISQAQALCGFVPTAETVLGLLATGRPELSAAVGIAHAICNAVAPGGRRARSLQRPVVAGVPIEGEFAR